MPLNDSRVDEEAPPGVLRNGQLSAAGKRIENLGQIERPRGHHPVDVENVKRPNRAAAPRTDAQRKDAIHSLRCREASSQG